MTYVIGSRAHTVQSWYLLVLTLLFPTLIHCRSRTFTTFFQQSSHRWYFILVHCSLREVQGEKLFAWLSIFTFFFPLFFCYLNASNIFFQVYIRVNNVHLTKSKSLHLYRPVSYVVGQRGGGRPFLCNSKLTWRTGRGRKICIHILEDSEIGFLFVGIIFVSYNLKCWFQNCQFHNWYFIHKNYACAWKHIIIIGILNINIV